MKAEGELRRKRRRRAVKVRIDKMTISTAEFGVMDLYNRVSVGTRVVFTR
jgi:hypothetical protein